MATQRQSSSQNRSYYPVDIQPLVDTTVGNLGSVYGNINEFLNNPLGSNLFSGTIGPLLEALLPSEEAARTALADQFRMAGGGQGGALQSGAFANAAKLNERNILNNRSRVVAEQASNTFRNILSGLGLQLNAAEGPTRLIGSIRPLTEGSSQETASSTDPMQFFGFGGTGGLAGGGASILDNSYGNYQTGNYAPTNAAAMQSYGASPGIVGPNYNPNLQNDYGVSNINFAGFGGGNFAQQPHQYSPLDEWGYTAADWANDPYYQ
jgi:hypothetical protein